MKNHLFYLVLIMATITLYVSCSKDDSEENEPDSEMSSEKQITGFQFTADANETLSQDIIATINQNNRTVAVTVSHSTSIIALTPQVEVSAAATYSPTGTQDFTNPVTYTVTAEDGTEAEYVITVVVEPANEAQILSFSFLAENNDVFINNIELNIDQGTRMITVTLPQGTQESILSTLVPTIVISEGASI